MELSKNSGTSKSSKSWMTILVPLGDPEIEKNISYGSWYPNMCLKPIQSHIIINLYIHIYIYWYNPNIDIVPIYILIYIYISSHLPTPATSHVAPPQAVEGGPAAFVHDGPRAPKACCGSHRKKRSAPLENHRSFMGYHHIITISSPYHQANWGFLWDFGWKMGVHGKNRNEKIQLDGWMEIYRWENDRTKWMILAIFDSWEEIWDCNWKLPSSIHNGKSYWEFKIS